MLMNKKEIYTSPEVETLVVRFEGGVLSGSVDATSNELPKYEEDYDDWD